MHITKETFSEEMKTENEPKYEGEQVTVSLSAMKWPRPGHYDILNNGNPQILSHGIWQNFFHAVSDNRNSNDFNWSLYIIFW